MYTQAQPEKGLSEYVMSAPESPRNYVTIEEDGRLGANQDDPNGVPNCPKHKEGHGAWEELLLASRGVGGELRSSRGGRDSGYHSRNTSRSENGWTGEPQSSALDKGTLASLRVSETKTAIDQNWSAQAGGHDTPVNVVHKDRLSSSSSAYSNDSSSGIGVDPCELRKRTNHFWNEAVNMGGAAQSIQVATDPILMLMGEVDSAQVKHSQLVELPTEPVLEHNDDSIDTHMLRMSEEAKLMKPDLKRLVLETYVDSALNYHLRDRARGRYVYLLGRPGITDEQLSVILQGFGIRPGLALNHGLWDTFAVEHAASLANIDFRDEVRQWAKDDSVRSIRHSKPEDIALDDNSIFSETCNQSTMFTIEEWKQLSSRSSELSSSSSSSSDQEATAEEQFGAVAQNVRDGRITWWQAPAHFNAVADMGLCIDDLTNLLKDFGVESAQWLGLHAKAGHKEVQIRRQLEILKRRETLARNCASNRSSGCDFPSEQDDTNMLTGDDEFHRDLLNTIDDVRSGDGDVAEALELLKDFFENPQMSDTMLFECLAEYDITFKHLEAIRGKGKDHTSPVASGRSTFAFGDVSETVDKVDALLHLAEEIRSGFIDPEPGSINFKELLGNSAMTDTEMYDQLAIHGIEPRQLLDPNQQSLSRGLRAMYNAFCGGNIKHTEATQWCKNLFGEQEFELADLPDELNRRGLSTKIVPPQLYEGLEVDMNDIQNSIYNETHTQEEAFEQFVEAFESRLLDPIELVPYLRSIGIPADWVAAQMAVKPPMKSQSATSRFESISKMTGLDIYADTPSYTSSPECSPNFDMNILSQVQTIYQNVMSLKVDLEKAATQFRSVLSCSGGDLASKLADYGISVDEIVCRLEEKQAELVKRLESNTMELSSQNGKSRHSPNASDMTSAPAINSDCNPNRVDSSVDNLNSNGTDGKDGAKALPYSKNDPDLEAYQARLGSVGNNMHDTYSHFIRGDMSTMEALFHFRQILGAPKICNFDLAQELKTFGIPPKAFTGETVALLGGDFSIPRADSTTNGRVSMSWPLSPMIRTTSPTISANDFSSGMESQPPQKSPQIKPTKEVPASSLAKLIAGGRIDNGLEPVTSMMAEKPNMSSVRAKLERYNVDENSWYAYAHQDFCKRSEYQRKVLDARDRHFKARTNLEYAYVKYGKQHVYRSAEDKQKTRTIVPKETKTSTQDSFWGLISSPTVAKEQGLKIGLPEKGLSERFKVVSSDLSKSRTVEADISTSKKQETDTTTDDDTSGILTPLTPGTSHPAARGFDEKTTSTSTSNSRVMRRIKRYGDLSNLKEWTQAGNSNENVSSLKLNLCKRDTSNPDPSGQPRKQQKREDDLPCSSPTKDPPNAVKRQSSSDRSPSKRNASNPDPNLRTRKYLKRDNSPSGQLKRLEEVCLNGDLEGLGLSSTLESLGTDSRSPTRGHRHGRSLISSSYTLDEMDEAPIPEAFDFQEDRLDHIPVSETTGLQAAIPTSAINGPQSRHSSAKLDCQYDGGDEASLPVAVEVQDDSLCNVKGTRMTSNPLVSEAALPIRQSVADKGPKSVPDSEAEDDQIHPNLTTDEEQSQRLKRMFKVLEEPNEDSTSLMQSLEYLKNCILERQSGKKISEGALQKLEDMAARSSSTTKQRISSAAKESRDSTLDISKTSPRNVEGSNQEIDYDQKLMDAGANEGRSCLSDFIVRSKEQDPRTKADRCNGYRYFGNQGTAPSYSQYPSSLHKLFDSYRDNPKDSPDVIGIEGAMKYLEALGINLDEVSVLVISEALQSPTMGEFTRDGYMSGWQRLAVGQPSGAGSVATQSVLIGKQCSNLPYDKELFKRVYMHTFQIARNPGQKAIILETAIEYWRLLFTHPSVTWNTATTPWLDYYLKFLETRWKKGVNKDMWTMTFSFYTKSKEDEDFGWWSEDGAWPSVLDEFVRFVQEKRGSDGTVEKMEVE